jgi:hypothetical protein
MEIAAVGNPGEFFAYLYDRMYSGGAAVLITVCVGFPLIAMKLCTKLCTNFIFSVFSGTFLRAKNKKIRTRKVRKKLDNKGKTGDFSSPVLLV